MQYTKDSLKILKQIKFLANVMKHAETIQKQLLSSNCPVSGQVQEFEYLKKAVESIEDLDKANNFTIASKLQKLSFDFPAIDSMTMIRNAAIEMGYASSGKFGCKSYETATADDIICGLEKLEKKLNTPNFDFTTLV